MRGIRLRANVALALAVGALITAAPLVSAEDPPAGGPQPSVAPSGGGAKANRDSIAAQVLSGSSMILPRAGTIVVQTLPVYTAASIDDLSLSQPVNQALIGDASHTPTSVTVGTFTAGTNLVFSLHSSFTNQTYLSTGGNAIVQQDGPDRWTVGWEDWTDFNYSDVVMVVCYQGSTPGCPVPAAQTLGFGAFGNGASPQALQSDPVNSATGNYVNQATDAALPGRGIGSAFVRSYNSLSTDAGSLGLGWTHSYGARIVLNPDGSATFVAEDAARVTYAADGAGGYIRPPGSYGLLATSTGGGFVMTRKDQVKLRFDAAGSLVSQTDRNGNVISLAYTAGQLSTITDTVGRVLTLGYDPQGRLTSLAFPPSRMVTYQYDAGGRLWKVTVPESGVTTYTYDQQGRLATITDANGNQVVQNIYGPDGRVSEQVDARGYRSFFAWDPATQTSTLTDARGGEWVDTYSSGVLVSRRDPLGNTTRYSFDASLGLVATVDANGRTFVTDSDTFGNPLRRRYPQPFDYSETWTYNAKNDPLSHVDRRGNRTTFTYDAAGNLKTVNEPYAQFVYPVTTYNYDPAGTGLLFSVVDPLLKTTSFAYDATGNRNRVTTPLGNVTTMGFDAAGRMTSLVEPRGNVAGGDPTQYTTTLAYDGLDRLRTTTSPLGNVTTVGYDAVGNRTRVTDANNNTTAFAYDAANHLTLVTDALLNPTAYAYDAAGNLVSRTDANTRQTAYTYDLAGRFVTETQPLGRTWTYTYSPTGRLTKVVDPIAGATPDPNDFQVTYAYDELDRLATANFGAGGTTAYGYDANDNRTSVTNPTGTATYAYDALNRLLTYRFGTRGIDYATGATGNVYRRTYTDGTVVDYTWNDDHRLTAVASGGATTTYGYDAAGNVTSTTLPAGNGYVGSRTYDRDGRLTEVRNQKGATVLSRSTYTMDPAGNRLTTQTTTETVSYAYDRLDRLTEACYTSTCTGGTDPFRRYTYDPVGNRLTEARSAGTTTYTYNQLDELTQTTGFGGTVNSSYDLDGQTLTAGSASFSWNRQGWLASRSQSGATTTYSYDGDGLRFEASTGTQASKKTQLDWDPLAGVAQLVAERNGSGSLLRRYVNGLDAISVTASNKTAYLLYDGLGSVVNLTSSTGATWWTYSYLPYGGVRTETKNSTQAIDNTLRFAGEYLDPTGLYYLRAREYDPATGRFISTDPVGPRPEDPYVSAYAYARQNPAGNTDPSGRCPIAIVLAALGALGGSIVPVAGTAAGAAGGASVGLVFCGAELAVEGTIIASSVLDQKTGDVIPRPAPAPQVFEPYVPEPGPAFDPDTGDQIPTGSGCSTTRCRVAVVALAAMFGIGASYGGEEGLPSDVGGGGK